MTQVNARGADFRGDGMRYLVNLFALVLLLTIGSVRQGNAHGSHVRFLEPGLDAMVIQELDVRIARAGPAFPYVFMAIRPYLHPWARQAGVEADDAERWSGLVPLSPDGYVQKIDVSEWPQGLYVIEAQYVGDFVQNVQSRRFVLRHVGVQ